MGEKQAFCAREGTPGSHTLENMICLARATAVLSSCLCCGVVCEVM